MAFACGCLLSENVADEVYLQYSWLMFIINASRPESRHTIDGKEIQIVHDM